MQGARVAGDVLTTATASADAARIGDAAETLGNDEARDQSNQANEATATGPDVVTPGRPPGAQRQQSPQRQPRPQRQERAEIASAPQSAPSGVGVRRRLARLGAQRGSGVNPVLEPLMKTIRATHPKADIRTVERAYEAAAYWHRGQKRKSGDPYITHPLAVATILAELAMTTGT